MFKTQYAKVVDSTATKNPEAKTLIKQICKIDTIICGNKTVYLLNKEETTGYWFNFSDVLPATEEEYKAQFEKKEIEEIPEYERLEVKTRVVIDKVNELVRVVNKLSK